MSLIDNWMNGHKHCDDYIDDESADGFLRDFLYFHRLPAVDRGKLESDDRYMVPRLFADYTDSGITKRVRVVMASRFGDVGITPDLKASHGYVARVAVDQLTNFSNSP